MEKLREYPEFRTIDQLESTMLNEDELEILHILRDEKRKFLMNC